MQKAAVAGREIRGYTRRQDGFHDILAFAFFRRSREGGVSEQRLVELAAAFAKFVNCDRKFQFSWSSAMMDPTETR